MNTVIKVLTFYALCLVLSIGVMLAFGLKNWLPDHGDVYAPTWQQLVALLSGIGNFSVCIFITIGLFGMGLDKLTAGQAAAKAKRNEEKVANGQPQ